MRFRLILAALLATAATASADDATQPAPHILVDQFGYLPDLAKRAVIRDPEIGFDADRSFTPGTRYAVIDLDSGKAVLTAATAAWNKARVDTVSGDRVWYFDFSRLTTPGRYVVRDLDRAVDSDPFEIGEDVYAPVLHHAFRSYYYQRAGFEKRAPFAAKGYEDSASHLGEGQDGQARRYDAPDDGATERDLRGGWYDAGDYNQYTSWTANYVSALLNSYRDHPGAWTDAMGIPESGNGVPDVLDEAVWALDWLERMQNADGSMLSVLGRAEGSPPSTATGPSRYGPANTSATLTAAGAFALASEIASDHPELSENAARYRKAALKAWSWAQANPDVTFYNNSEEHGSKGLAAGQQEVDPERLAKKALIAVTQLYGLTKNPAFLPEAEALYADIGGIRADTANGFEGELGFTLLAFADRDGVPEAFRDRIRSDYAAALNADNGLQAVRNGNDAYMAHVDGYWWGSNGTKARRGSVFSQAVGKGLDGAEDAELRNVAAGYLHYLHGVNPMGLVYLTNMGEAGAERSASTLYHAWFKDGSELYDSTRTSRFGPVPGLVVGGPNPGYERDACCDGVCGGYGDAMCKLPPVVPPTGQPPAKSYGEFNEGWPLNSWSVTENSLGYQSDYIRLLAAFVDRTSP